MASAKTGASQLNSGAKKLQSGISQYTAGVDSLASGVNSYTEGVDTVNSNMAEYNKGMKSLTDGVNKYVAWWQNQLADGVTAYVNGATQLTDGSKHLCKRCKCPGTGNQGLCKWNICTG